MRTAHSTPTMYTGIWSASAFNFPYLAYHAACSYCELSDHWNAGFGSSMPGPQVITFGFVNLATHSVSIPQWRDAYMGGTVIQLTDPEPPRITEADPTLTENGIQVSASKWTKDGTFTFAPRGTDSAAATPDKYGLGMRIFRLAIPLSNGTTTTQERGIFCDGTNSLPCPTTAKVPYHQNQGPFRVPVIDGDDNPGNGNQPLPEGHVSITVGAGDALSGLDFDENGRTHATLVTKTVKIDRTPPTGELDGVNEDQLLRAQSYKITGVAADRLSGSRSIEITLDGVRKAYRGDCPLNATDPCTLSWTLDGGDRSLTEGVHTLRLNATDQAGNSGDAIATRRFRVERTPPEVEVQGTLMPEDREWVARGAQSLMLDAEDAGTGVVSARVEVGARLVKEGEVTQECASGACGLIHDFLIDTDDVDPAEGAQPLANAAHPAVLIVRDGAGNERRVPWTIRQERTPPELTLSGSLKLAEGQTLTEDQTYQLTAAATEASPSPAQSGMGTIDFVVDDEEPGDGVEEDCPQGGCPLTREFSYATGEYAGGGHTVRVIATDRAGNTTEQTVAVDQPPEPVHECDTPPAPVPVVNPAPLTPSLALGSFQSPDGLPEAFSPSSVLDWGELRLQPALRADDPLEFVAAGVFSGVRVDREAADGATVTVDGGEGAICLTPTSVALAATQPISPSPPISPVNGVTTLFANSHPATDTAIRPSVTGVSSMLQLRGPLAPEEFSWHVDLQPELALKELPDGGVAVVLPTEPGTDIAEMSDPPAPPTVAEQRAALPDTARHLSQDENELARIQASQPDEIVAVIRKPWAKGPQGEEVATSLRARGSVITMSVPRALTQSYPVVAHMQVSDTDATDEGTAAQADYEATEWTEADEDAFDETAAADPSDPTPDPLPAPDDAPEDEIGQDAADELSSAGELLIEGPGEENPDAPGADTEPPDATTAGVRMSVLQARANEITVGTSEADVKNEVISPQARQLGAKRTLRPMVHWNIYNLVKLEESGELKKRETNGSKRATCKRKAVHKWLAFARAAADRRVRVMPTFNLGIIRDEACQPAPTAPPVGQYRGAISKFLDRWEFVRRITALNEPNLHFLGKGKQLRPGHPSPRRAAYYWVEANALCRRLGPDGKPRCAAVPAGDFAGSPGDPAFKSKRSACTGKRPNRKCRPVLVKYRRAYHTYLFRKAKKKRPLIWAFHAWGDLHRFEVRSGRGRKTAPIIRHFRRTYASKKYEYAAGKSPAVWVTEVGAAYRHTCRQINIGVTRDARRDYRNSRSRCGDEPAAAKHPDGSYNRKGDPRALRFGELRQRNAVAFLFRAMAKPETELAPIERLYYYNVADNRGALVPQDDPEFYTGRCAGPKRCPILESGLVGSLVDDVPDEQQPNVIIRDFKRKSPDLSVSNRPRPAFCVLKAHRVRPVTTNRRCDAGTGEERKP